MITLSSFCINYLMLSGHVSPGLGPGMNCHAFKWKFTQNVPYVQGQIITWKFVPLFYFSISLPGFSLSSSKFCSRFRMRENQWTLHTSLHTYIVLAIFLGYDLDKWLDGELEWNLVPGCRLICQSSKKRVWKQMMRMWERTGKKLEFFF